FLRFCLACTPLAHDAQRRLDDGILRALWLSPDELCAYRLRSPLVRPCLDDWLAGERLPLTLLRTIG
ncbi:MAG TPA: NUDIX hydrolase, partial [Plasticicumulans sp.]|nr:NUDIX hydrolase [Plasticicumulans sp.]